ncbi:MAG: hypothetical protein V3V08_11870 [Nannocystaceae bacterium]
MSEPPPSNEPSAPPTEPDNDEEALDLDQGIDALHRTTATAPTRGSSGSEAPDKPDLSGSSDRSDEPDEPDEPDELDPIKRRGPRRSPIVSAVVVLFGCLLLSSMYPDFRHWIRSVDDARDLGHARDIIVGGQFTEDFHNEYVVVAGSPDVQHAAKLTTAQGTARYMRIREGGASLFVQVPRPPDRKSDEVLGTFRGRMLRLGDTRAFAWAQKFFQNEVMVQTIALDPVDFARQNRTSSGELHVSVSGEDRTVLLSENDRLHFVVQRRTATIQLGKHTWPSLAAAEQAVAALGYPFTHATRSARHVHVFAADIPDEQREAAALKLNAGHAIPTDNADPKLGALILARSATYVVAPDEVRWTQNAWRVPPGHADPGYEMAGSHLIRKNANERTVDIPFASPRAIRLDRVLELDPDGYLIVVGEDPASQRLVGILFLVVCGLVGTNLASFLLMMSRRRTARQSRGITPHSPSGT